MRAHSISPSLSLSLSPSLTVALGLGKRDSVERESLQIRHVSPRVTYLHHIMRVHTRDSCIGCMRLVSAKAEHKTCIRLLCSHQSTSTRILLHIERDEALADSSWIRRRCTWLCHWRSCARDSLPCRQGQPSGLYYCPARALAVKQ